MWLAKLDCPATPQCTLPSSPSRNSTSQTLLLSCAGRIVHCRRTSIMSADEVICLESSSDEDVPSSLSRRSAVRVASVNKSAATAAAKVHGGEKMAQKRRSSLVEPELGTAGPSHSKMRQVQNSPAQPGCSSQTPVGAARKVVKPKLVAVTKIPIPYPDEDVFQNFVKACLKRRDDKDTKQVLFKLEKLHSKLSATQRQDNEFRLLISNCYNMISKSLAKDIYTPILELRNEIKRLIKAPVVEQQQNRERQEQQQQQETRDEKPISGGDIKKIRQLESSIAKCLEKIKELEEKEVDFDDDDDSAYIQEDKYKKRLIQLYNALSKVSGDKVLKKQLMKKKIKRIDISDEMTGIPLVDEAILNFINSDINKINQFKHLEYTQRVADHIKMPEYLDILKCIEKCNKDNDLDLRKEKIEKLAKRAFSTFGNFLKKKRTDETKCYFQSFLDETCQDPAKNDVTLNKKLCENKKEGDKKLDEIFEKYVDKQKGLSQEDMEKQQQVSSDTGDGQNSSNSISSSSESEETSKHEDETKTSVEPTPKSKIISSIDVDEDENERSARILKCPATAEGNDDDNDVLDEDEKERNTQILKCPATAEGNDDDNDVLDITDVDARDPLDNQVSSPAVETKTLPLPNEILNVESSPRLVFNPTKSSTPTTIKAAQHKVSPQPPRNKPLAAAIDTASKENAGEVNCCKPNKTPVIKVCAFAKPPAAWGGPSSPEKARKTFKPRPADSSFTKRRSSSPECIDLTKEEREKQLTISPRLPSFTARSINPLANKKRTTPSAAASTASTSLSQPAKRVVIVKNVINNFHVPLSGASAAAAAAGSRGKNIFHPSRSNNTFSKHSRDNVWLSKDKKK